jgi:hypothetical protein
VVLVEEGVALAATVEVAQEVLAVTVATAVAALAVASVAVRAAEKVMEEEVLLVPTRALSELAADGARVAWGTAASQNQIQQLMTNCRTAGT